MNIGRVGVMSFGNYSPYYKDIKDNRFVYNGLSANKDYKLDAIYSMLDVIRDEQKEQAKIITKNQVVLRNMLSDMARDNGRYHDDLYYANNIYEKSNHRINTIA